MARPNGYFDLDSDGSGQVDFGDDSPFGDLANDDDGQSLGPLFATAPATEIFGSRFNSTQSDELVAINANNPQIGITDFAQLINERLDALLDQVRTSEDRIALLLDELVTNPDQVANEDLLRAIEEFVEVSKYALVTYEAMQRKIDRILPQSIVADDKELEAMKTDLSRILYDRIEDRGARHKEFVELIGAKAKRDEQLTALVAKVYSDLGVSGDDDFNDSWLTAGKKVFVTLPDTQIEFLKRFDKILEKAVEESRKTNSFFKSDRGTDSEGSGTFSAERSKKASFGTRLRNLKDRAIGSVSEVFHSGAAKISNRFASSKFSLKKASAVLVAIGITAGGVALGARQLGSESNDVSNDDRKIVTDDSVVSPSVTTPENTQASEPLNPHTNKPFTETEIKFLTWVNEQMAQGKSEADIAQMMANLVASQNADQVPVEIGSASTEINSNFQSRRTGGDSSRRAQVRARSEAARRNQQARQNAPVIPSPSSIPSPTDQGQTTTTTVNAPEETVPTTIPDITDNTTTTSTTSTTVPSSTTTSVVPGDQTQLGQASLGETAVSNPRGLESISIDLR